MCGSVANDCQVFKPAHKRVVFFRFSSLIISKIAQLNLDAKIFRDTVLRCGKEAFIEF